MPVIRTKTVPRIILDFKKFIFFIVYLMTEKEKYAKKKSLKDFLKLRRRLKIKNRRNNAETLENSGNAKKVKRYKKERNGLN